MVPDKALWLESSLCGFAGSGWGLITKRKMGTVNACKIWAPHAPLTPRSPVERASGEKIRT